MQDQFQSLTATPETSALLAYWSQHSSQVVDDALDLQAIPAPTFDESARGGAMLERFHALGLADVHRDDVGNVYGRTPGASADRPALLVSAHLDTVFPADTDLSTRRDASAGRIYGPGLGDNSLGLAALLGLARQFGGADAAPPVDIWWVCTVGEEGLGDLRGMRGVVRRLSGRLGAGLVLEGIGLGWIYHAGLGVRRLRITVHGPGGHSWLYPAPPSAVHALLTLGARLVERVQPPADPRSAFNIGTVEGGLSVNTRAAYASLNVDLRSVDGETLARLEDQLREVVGGFEPEPGLTVGVDVIGNRPSAALPADHPLVDAAQAALRAVGWEDVTLSTGSTDANVLLANGIPTVCVGITTGGAPHTLNEYINLEPIATGMKQVALLTMLAAAGVGTWRLSAPSPNTKNQPRTTPHLNRGIPEDDR
jgi:tripeptide aminopeptidase